MIDFIWRKLFPPEDEPLTDLLSIRPNSAVVYAGQVGIWTSDVSRCTQCGLKGHLYQQRVVCVKCGEATERVVGKWLQGTWIIKEKSNEA